jgi:GNAT superfamily N-acetyltransferase
MRASSRIGHFPTPMTTRCSRCCRLPGLCRSSPKITLVHPLVRCGHTRGSPPLRCDALPELCIAVAPGHRGAGIGGMLLSVLFADLAKSHDAMCTNVHVRNPAKRLYERNGFRADGQGNGPLGLALIKRFR